MYWDTVDNTMELGAEYPVSTNRADPSSSVYTADAMFFAGGKCVYPRAKQSEFFSVSRNKEAHHQPNLTEISPKLPVWYVYWDSESRLPTKVDRSTMHGRNILPLTEGAKVA